MKKFISLMMCIVLVCISMAGCKGTEDTEDTEDTKVKLKYGTYQIEDIKYLPLFSSSTSDYFLKNNLGVLFIAKDKNFSTNTKNATSPSVHKVSYDDVQYVEESIDHVILPMGEDVGIDSIGKIDISSYNEKACYKVMSNNEDTGFRIYYLDKEVWIAHFSWFGEKKNAWWANYIFSVSYKE